MFKSKAYVCNQCRRVISYSVSQGGTTVPCKFCGTPANLPADKNFRPDSPAKRTGRRGLCLLLILALAGVGIGLLLKPGHQGANPLLNFRALLVRAFMREDPVTVAPAPAAVRGLQATIAVTEVRYGCQDIYHSALKKALPSETPVCCLKIAIVNTGETPVEFHTWRIVDALAGQKKAVLTDNNGRAFGLGSYGIDAYPSGTRQHADIAPGETVTDWVLFVCDAKPQSDLTLSLPCENVGGLGDLRFTIPCGMIR